MKKRTRKPREGDIRGFAQYEEGEWVIYTYEDFFLGEWIGNEEIWHDGVMIIHATITTGAIKSEDLPKMLHDGIELHKLLIEEEKNGTRKPPVKFGMLKELLDELLDELKEKKS